MTVCTCVPPEIAVPASERRLLGAALLAPEQAQAILAGVRVTDFAPELRPVFEAVVALVKRGDCPTPAAVEAWMRQSGSAPWRAPTPGSGAVLVGDLVSVENCAIPASWPVDRGAVLVAGMRRRLAAAAACIVEEVATGSLERLGDLAAEVGSQLLDLQDPLDAPGYA